MKNMKDTLVVVGVLLALVLGVIGLVQPSVQQPIGATPGSDNTGNFFSQGGVEYYSASIPLNVSTSSKVAVLRNPFGNATTSVRYLSVQINTGVLGANSYDISTSSSANCLVQSSSTPAFVYDRDVATGARDNLIWMPISSSSPSASEYLTSNTGVTQDGSSPFFLAPNECLTVRVATSSPGTFSSFWTGRFNVLLLKQ